MGSDHKKVEMTLFDFLSKATILGNFPGAVLAYSCWYYIMALLTGFSLSSVVVSSSLLSCFLSFMCVLGVDLPLGSVLGLGPSCSINLPGTLSGSVVDQPPGH